jgi:arginine N-succinyltransferase
MLLIRPIRTDDLDQLHHLTTLSSFGLTNLPKDRELLAKHIRASVKGFEEMDEEEPKGQPYLFVLEDTEEQVVVGTAAIISKVGGFQPFYSYQIKTTVHESEMLGVRKEIQMLHLLTEHDGPCEVASLYLHPDYRRSGNGRVLSLSRFLFMAEFPKLFDKTVMAEMRGVVDEYGYSPFWESLGRHFFDLDFPSADYLTAVNKQFIADLMPTHPIYIPLLPPAAQAVIGKVHDHTKPALRMLESEGFQFKQTIDIFQGGPIVQCNRDQIRTIHASRHASVAALTLSTPESVEYLVSNVSRQFRCCKTTLNLVGDQVELPRQAAHLLQVGEGHTVRYVTLRP